MDDWKSKLNGDPIPWLLEADNPAVRYFTLRDLLGKAENDRAVRAAKRALMQSAPIKKILAAQDRAGYWAKPGHGYSPKYTATVWQILFLAELGADDAHAQIKRGCDYLLEHAQSANGGFSAYADVRPSGAIHCLNGNLIWALIALGYGDDERVHRAVDWLAGAITGDDLNAFNALTPGPGFRCGINDKQPCAWGAVKALRALNALPKNLRTPRVSRATQIAIDFLLSRDLAKADYPSRRVSAKWFQFGFPLSYTSDVLEGLLALTKAGYGNDPRLANARDLVLSKQNDAGRWTLKHSLNRKMWTSVEEGKPSKWITLRALRVLSRAQF